MLHDRAARPRHPLAGLAGTALLAVGLPLLLTLVVLQTPRDEGVRPTAAYLVLVVLATASSGMRAGVLCWFVSSVALWWFVLAPKQGFVGDEASDTISMVVFLITAVVAVIVVNRLRDDRLRAREELRLRHAAEEEVRAAADRAHVVQQLAQSLSAATGVRAVAEVVVRHAGTGVGADAAAVMLLEDDADELSVAASVGYGEELVRTWRSVPVDSPAPLAQAARQGRPTFVEDEETWRAGFPPGTEPPETPFRSRAVLPLARPDGALVGVLVVSWSEHRRFAADDRTFLITVASVCSSALQRAALAEERERTRFASALEAMIDPVGIFSAVRDDEGRVVDFRVEFANDSLGRPGGPYPRGFSPPVGATVAELFDSPGARERIRVYAQVVDTREPARMEAVPITDPDTGEARVYDIHVSPFGDGVIVATRDVTARERAARALAESDARLRAAQRVAHVGSWETDLASDETVWSEELYRMFGADPGEPPGEVLRRSVEDAPRLRALVAHLAETGVPMDTEYDVVRPDGARRRFRARAELHDGEHGGVVRGVVQDITDERELQAAVSALRADLRDERAAVEVLQRALLPQALPRSTFARVHATYRPAGSRSLVGGDWYDAFELPSGRLALTVGDVAGHGIGAAAAMSELRHALRALSRTSAGPAQTLAALDQLYLASEDEPYATCLLAVLEQDCSRLTLANAGHLPMVMLRDGVATPVRTRPGAPLGAGLARYEDHGVETRPGDRLLVYTDGLVERRGEPVDEGVARLCRTAEQLPPLPARDLCERLTALLLRESDHEDDVCVVAVEVVGPAAG